MNDTETAELELQDELDVEPEELELDIDPLLELDELDDGGLLLLELDELLELELDDELLAAVNVNASGAVA